MSRLLRWFAADAAAEGQPNPLASGFWCEVCGTRLDKADRPCPMGCAR
jgi:rubrerythrin